MEKTKINDYRNALVEVEAVLNCLSEDVYNEIPKEIIDLIEENKNTEYEFYYDEDEDLENWNLSSEAKAILYNIYKDYLADSEEKDYFRKKEYFERMQEEKQKAIKYNPNVFQQRNVTTNIKTQANTNTAIKNNNERNYYNTTNYNYEKNNNNRMNANYKIGNNISNNINEKNNNIVSDANNITFNANLTNNDLIVVTEEKWYKKLFNKIKRLFKI